MNRDAASSQGRMRLMWERLRHLVAPRIDDETLHVALHRLRHGLPPPAVWLLGKVQSGKTSIIHALTGAERAQIGDGCKPCTRRTARYDFPDASVPLAVFLDTRGLGEAGYNPREDLASFQAEAHVLLVVVKAMDVALEQLLAALEAIVHARPSLSVVVAQTTLHEGYPPDWRDHLSPYPFASPALAATIPAPLSRALAFQRALFARVPVHRFVPLDFTLPEDGFADPFYGRDALLDALAEVHPHGVYETLRQLPHLAQELKDLHFRKAQPHILAYAFAAGAVGAMPIPVADLPFISTLQVKMLHTVTSIYRQPLGVRTFLEMLVTDRLFALTRETLNQWLLR